MIFISLETASIWCSLWNGTRKTSSLYVDSFISRSEPVRSRTPRWCWRWDGAGLDWTFDSTQASTCRVCGIYQQGPAAAHGDFPRIFFWKLYPVINLLSVISTLKYFVVVSENSTFAGFETLTCQRGFSGLAGLWLSLVTSILVKSTLCDTFVLCHWCTGTSCLWGTVL